MVMVLNLGTMPYLCCGHSGSDGSDGGRARNAMAVVGDALVTMLSGLSPSSLLSW